MIKRIFSFVLAALLLCGLLPQLGVQVQAAGNILDAQEVDGKVYSATYGQKLNNIFRGEVDLFTNSGVRYPLGSSMKNSGSYTVAGVLTGSQCYIYAQAVYYYLFGDVVHHGDGLKYWSDSTKVLNNKKTASYALFANAGVGFGAYMRTTPNSNGSYNSSKGHSLIILTYNEQTVTFLEGNADGKGLVRITELTWDGFNDALLSGKGRRIAHVVQCDSAACMHKQYTSLGACALCGESFDYEGTFSPIPTGYYTAAKTAMKVTPYAAAGDVLVIEQDTRLEAWGTVSNFFEETWYQVIYDGKTGYLPADALIPDPVTPGKPALIVTGDYSDDHPMVFSWKETANTTHYVLRLQQKDVNGDWQLYAEKSEADSGLSLVLPAGEYQSELYAWNTRGEVLVTQAEQVNFTIFHTHSYTAVVTTQATCTVAGETKHLCTECGNSYTEMIPVEDHDYVNMRCTACNAAEKPVCDLAVKRSSGKPVLSWGKVSGAKKYEVYRATSETGNYTKLTTTTKTTYTDSKASADSRYFYKIRVVSSNASNGKYSALRSTCARPAVKTALTEEGKPMLSWAAVEGALRYHIYRSTKSGSGYKVIDTVEEISYTDLSVTAGKTYYYKVVAVGEDSVSAYSSYKKVAAKCAVPDLQAPDSTGKATLTWNKVAGAKKYELYRSVNGGKFTKVTTTTKTTYTDTKATGGAVCTYKVRALGASSSYHSAYSETVDCYVACAAPSLTVKADIATGKPVLTWNKVTGAVSYEIYRSENGGEYTLIATQTAVFYKDTDTQTGISYGYKIRSLGKAEVFHSLQSDSKSATAQCAQPKPKGKISKDGKPVLVWDEVGDADHYLIYRSTSKSSGYKLLDETDDLTYSDTTAKKNKTYYYKIVAVSGSTQSARSGYVKIKATK